MKIFIFLAVVTSVAAELEMGKKVFISVKEIVNEVLSKKGLTSLDIAVIMDDLAKLQEVVKNQEQEVLDLKHELKVQNIKKEQRIVALEKKNSEMETLINELKEKMILNEKDLASDVTNYDKEVNNTFVREPTLADYKRFQPKAVPGTGIAFSAYIGSADIRNHLAAGHTLICDQVIFNDGNHYSAFTGIFRAPRTGVYLLTYTMATAFQNKWLWVKLVVDNRMIVRSGTDAQYNDHVVNGGNTAILRLNQGESVWLEVEKAATDAEVWMVDRTTTFSGVLLYG